MQIKDGDYYHNLAKEGTTVTVPVKSSRGEIVDRYGRSMAVNRSGFSVVLEKAYLPSSQQNEIILWVIRLLEQQGETWNDALPISTTVPFSFLEGQSTLLNSILNKFRLNQWATAENVLDAMAESYGVEGFTPEETRLIVAVRFEMERRGFNTQNPYTLADSVSRETALLIEENNFNLPGVAIQEVAVRDYVCGEVGAHLIGQVGPIFADEYQSLSEQGYAMNDVIGRGGIEGSFEEYLRGTDGEQTITFDNQGQVIETKETKAPEPGGTVILSLDMDLQRFAQDALDRRIEEIRANADEGDPGYDITAGTVVIQDVKTGEILTMASSPGYDLSTYLENYAQLAADERNPLWNRATNGTYAPGSTFKPCVTLAALAEGIIDENKLVDCEGVYTYYDDYRPTCMSVHGRINFYTALRYSCNVYYYEIGRLLGIENIEKYANAMGLGEKTGLEIGEASGVIASPEQAEVLHKLWNPGDVIAAAIGQSDTLVTPVQLAAYAATLANRGLRLQSHLVSCVKSYTLEEDLYTAQPTTLSDLTEYKEYFEEVKDGMVLSARSGTVQSWFGSYAFDVATKTGTPQTGHEAKSNNATFIAFAPANDPEIAISVVLEQGGHGYYAAPLVKDILDYYFFTLEEIDAPTQPNMLLP